MSIPPYQHELRSKTPPNIPNVYGNIDYVTFRKTLIKIDEILTNSGFEHKLISQTLQSTMAGEAEEKTTFRYKTLRHALRCNISRHLTGESYRVFSIRLNDSALFQWFTGIDQITSRKAGSKSALERYEKYFDQVQVADTLRGWLGGLTEEAHALKSGLNKAIDCGEAFADSTCIKANIHFPVDWVLLKDGARSLLSAIDTIRAQGLKHRMVEPSALLKKMNKLCIKMSHTRRKKDSKKGRKRILREMKKLIQRISKHAYRYRALLEARWDETEWTETEAHCVIGRIDAIVSQLPGVIKQAHERIIGERQVPTKEKVLSLYDKDTQVIVRGKSGSEVEFGQSLLLVEQRAGLIMDWELFAEQAPSDSALVQPIIKRLEKHYGPVKTMIADRAFGSEKNDNYLASKDIFNGICPKSPKRLQEKLTDSKFVALQTRRSQTEARIGIFKNVFLGRPLRSRQTGYKRHAINWCVLTHNLWVLSRMTLADEKQLSLKKAA